jgi:hypothetical protein
MHLRAPRWKHADLLLQPIWPHCERAPSSRPHGACATQILVELAELQDAEVGDGTTSVVILAAELLKRANELVKLSIHPTNIISGYRLAMREVSSGE